MRATCEKGKTRAIGRRKANGTQRVGRAATRGKTQMRELGTKTIRVGITLGAIVGLVGCGEQSEGIQGDHEAALQGLNGLSAYNGLSSLNGLSSMNGLSGANGLAGMNGLSAANG